MMSPPVSGSERLRARAPMHPGARLAGMADAANHEPGEADREPGSSRERSIVRSVAYLVIAAVALYLLLPTLVAVFSSWRALEHLEWAFAALVVVFEIASSVCLWELDRIALSVDGWFPVASSQLAGNALGRIVPGSATPTSVLLLRRAGIDAGDAAAALTASTLLQIATALALPVLAVPAMIGGAPVDRGLATAAYLGIAVIVLLAGAAVLLFSTDAPLAWIGRSVQSILNATLRRRRPLTGIPGNCCPIGTSSDRP